VSENYSGLSGKILRVDLSNQRIWDEVVDGEVLRKYIGGTCLGAKYLYEEVNPRQKWSDPENRVFIGSGILGGTRIPGSGAFSMVTKGALNNGVASTQANGTFGAYLRFSGFDGMVIQGAAPDWKYLYIHDGTAELKDAKHLSGGNTWEVEEAIKQELGGSDRSMSVFSIGPAGENLVKFAGIFGDRGHSASHNGSGAVWGSKKLKAIAVARSSGRVEVANPKEISNLAKEFLEDFKKHVHFTWGTSRNITSILQVGALPVRNYTTNLFPECPKLDGEYTRSHFEVKNHPCWACPSYHIQLMKVTEGPYAGFSGKEPEYEQWAAWGPQIGVTDPGAVVMLSNVVDRFGFDCNEGAWLVGWVMECYEKGLLTAKDLDGLELTWGNAEAVRSLVENIAYRRGFGNILAEGVKYAAEYVGGEATKLAVYTMRPNTPRTHDHRGRWVEMLDSCITNSGTLETQPAFIIDLTKYGLPKSIDPFSWQQVSEAEARAAGSLTFCDSLVVCAFSAMCNLPLLAEAVSAATGWDFSFDEALKAGRRALNLMRVYNVRAGHTPSLEKPSPKYCSTPVDGPNKGKSIVPHLEDMLNNYYSLMGWDRRTGLPLPETLAELGLEYLIKDLGANKAD